MSLLDASSLQEALLSLYRQSQKKGTTAGAYSRRLGYKSPRLLEMVLKGDRQPTLDFLSRTADLFSLSDTERTFLELLASKEKLAAQGRPVEAVSRRIAALRKKVSSVEFIEPQFFTLFSDWHCLVVKQLLQTSETGLTIASLVKRLRGKATEAEVEKAVHALLHLGFVERGAEAGAFVGRKTPSLHTRPDLPSEAVRKHHRQMMERAIEALSEQGIADREMISLTFACPPSALPRLKEALRRFCGEIDAEYAAPSSSVYQLNLQLFSHTN